MALICDTSGLFALYDGSSAEHAATAAVVEAEQDELLLAKKLVTLYSSPTDLPADASNWLRNFKR